MNIRTARTRRTVLSIMGNILCFLLCRGKNSGKWVSGKRICAWMEIPLIKACISEVEQALCLWFTGPDSIVILFRVCAYPCKNSVLSHKFMLIVWKKRLHCFHACLFSIFRIQNIKLFPGCLHASFPAKMRKSRRRIADEGKVCNFTSVFQKASRWWFPMCL